jgi:hypothetical protein
MLVVLGCSSGPPAREPVTTAPHDSSDNASALAADQPAADQPAADQSEAPSLLGTWRADARCIPEMRGMEGADQATVESVAAQLANNTYVFTPESFEHHHAGASQPSVQPYTVLSHEEHRWTYEIAGPTGETMRMEAEIVDGQLRIHRDGQLELCLVR